MIFDLCSYHVLVYSVWGDSVNVVQGRLRPYNLCCFFFHFIWFRDFRCLRLFEYTKYSTNTAVTLHVSIETTGYGRQLAAVRVWCCVMENGLDRTERKYLSNAWLRIENFENRRIETRMMGPLDSHRWDAVSDCMRYKYFYIRNPRVWIIIIIIVIPNNNFRWIRNYNRCWARAWFVIFRLGFFFLFCRFFGWFLFQRLK